jgi:methylated-DNA-[protein]-cysteine S-methyltransferase
METAYLETPLGSAEIIWDHDGFRKVSVLTAPPPGRVTEAPENIRRQLNEYFEGRLRDFNLPINLQGTAFQKKVWESLLQIPYGKTMSYMQLAKQLGNPPAIRAIASAIGKNPLWIIVPCHRVTGTDGSLVGYAGGLWRKKWLLEHESPAKQQQLF